MNPNTYIQLKQSPQLVAETCDVGMDAQLKQKSRLVAYDCGVDMDVRPEHGGRVIALKARVLTPACRAGMDFGSTD